MSESLLNVYENPDGEQEAKTKDQKTSRSRAKGDRVSDSEMKKICQIGKGQTQGTAGAG